MAFKNPASGLYQLFGGPYFTQFSYDMRKEKSCGRKKMALEVAVNSSDF
jgi:hypothetical protein